MSCSWHIHFTHKRKVFITLHKQALPPGPPQRPSPPPPNAPPNTHISWRILWVRQMCLIIGAAGCFCPWKRSPGCAHGGMMTVVCKAWALVGTAVLQLPSRVLWCEGWGVGRGWKTDLNCLGQSPGMTVSVATGAEAWHVCVCMRVCSGRAALSSIVGGKLNNSHNFIGFFYLKRSVIRYIFFS